MKIYSELEINCSFLFSVAEMRLVLLCSIFLFLQADHCQSEFLKGVNYGNRFIPEDWMTSDQESIYGERYGGRVGKPADVARVSNR